MLRFRFRLEGTCQRSFHKCLFRPRHTRDFRPAAASPDSAASRPKTLHMNTPLRLQHACSAPAWKQQISTPADSGCLWSSCREGRWKVVLMLVSQLAHWQHKQCWKNKICLPCASEQLHKPSGNVLPSYINIWPDGTSLCPSLCKSERFHSLTGSAVADADSPCWIKC